MIYKKIIFNDGFLNKASSISRQKQLFFYGRTEHLTILIAYLLHATESLQMT